MYCIVQARCGSKRLNRKIFKKILNVSIIERVIKRLKKSKKISNIIIVTSKYKVDDDIEIFCKKKKINIYRGSLNNVASRFLEVSKIYNLKNMIRVSCDSPFIDSKLIDKGINLFKNSNYDMVTNVFPRTFPKGLSYEIFKTSVLQKNYKTYSKKDKEHVTTFFYKNSKKFKIYNHSSINDYKKLNLCVDTNNDLKFLRKNYNKIIYKTFI
jgi:spore coat polysaccharide biosynthesis protein SpsF (cytidylyltransferase family)